MQQLNFCDFFYHSLMRFSSTIHQLFSKIQQFQKRPTDDSQVDEQRFAHFSTHQGIRSKSSSPPLPPPLSPL